MTTQRPVPSGEIPDNFVLTPQQKQQRPPSIQYLLNNGLYLTSGILPSGQENYFDISQDFENNGGLAINSFYPSPVDQNGVFTGTGLLVTYPPWWFTTHPSGYTPEIRKILGILRQSGILNYQDLIGIFSNVSSVSGIPIQDFSIFNPYIHYYPSYMPITNDDKIYNFAVSIPYISDYEMAELYDPYEVTKDTNL